MKVLIQMGDSYPDESPCAKRMRTFHDVFRENGDQVLVLAPRGATSIKGYPDTIYCPTIRLKKKTTIYRFLNSFVFGLTSFFKSIPLREVDVVVTTAPPPLINGFGWAIARLKRAKLVYDVRDIWPDVAWEMGTFDKRSLYSRVFEALRNFMLKHADLVIAVSPGKVKKLKEYAPEANVIEITNGLDETFLENENDAAIARKYGLDEQFSVCYIGNLGLAQGLSQLLDVACRAQKNKLPVKFYLFGSGAEEQLLKQKTRENNLENVAFPGRIANKHMLTVLKHCSMSYVSLVNDNLRDSVPTKLYEALGAGCPVLLSACGDSEDILKESGLGIAVRPNDHDGLWGAFLEIYTHIERFKSKRDQALEYTVNHYSRQKAARLFETELHQLIRKRVHATRVVSVLEHD